VLLDDIFDQFQYVAVEKETLQDGILYRIDLRTFDPVSIRGTGTGRTLDDALHRAVAEYEHNQQAYNKYLSEKV
jgi:hypothetical protein